MQIKIVVVVSFIARGMLKMYLRRTLLNLFIGLFYLFQILVLHGWVCAVHPTRTTRRK